MSIQKWIGAWIHPSKWSSHHKNSGDAIARNLCVQVGCRAKSLQWILASTACLMSMMSYLVYHWSPVRKGTITLALHIHVYALGSWTRTPNLRQSAYLYGVIYIVGTPNWADTFPTVGSVREVPRLVSIRESRRLSSQVSESELKCRSCKGSKRRFSFFANGFIGFFQI